MNLENSDVRKITEDELKDITLDKDEYLLNVSGDTGFMVKLNKDGSVPASFLSWRQYYSDKGQLYIIKELHRTGWKIKGMRHGQSTAWIKLIHPFGFMVEINNKSFMDIIQKVDINKGVISTKCFFNAKLKNAELLVQDE